MKDAAQKYLSWAAAIEREVEPVLEAGVNRWAVVAAFYTAMHYVQAYIVESGLPVPENHRQRNHIVALEARLRTIYSPYWRLYNSGW